MADNEEIIKKTRLFGLNTYEAKIWTALLSRGVSTAGELSDIANVPRSRSYDVLESLEKKGFVVMKLGKPIKYLAVPPKGVLENIKKQIEKSKEKHLSQITNTSFSDLINTFQELYEKTTKQTENIVAILHGRKNTYKHLGFLFNNTKKDIIFSLENETKDHVEITKLMKDKTKKIIKSPLTNMRMYVVGEDNTIIFPISEKEVHPDYDLSIWIKNKPTTKFLKQLLVSA
jgi:sugar-specific transcriptional regulator TrmB